jgi:16S rRNA (uracil1498-N3)-methyltransferase
MRTSWRPVYFARSRSVSPRGEGEKFREKLRARMQAALEQSGGAWLPDILEEAEAETALALVPATWCRIILDANGAPLAQHVRNEPTSLAVGPEGGLESRELSAARERGWLPASLASTTLRFETAIVASAAIVRALQLTSGTR